MDVQSTDGGGQATDSTRESTALASTSPAQTGTAAPKWLRRTLVIAGGVCAFALVGSMINPEWSSASDDWRRPVRITGGGSASAGPGAAGRTPIAEPRSLIGTLESREFRILIHHGDPVPLYTVCMPDGRVLRANLEAGDVYREFPGINLERMLFDPTTGEGTTGPLMLVYPLD
jgi:hypothetical protein